MKRPQEFYVGAVLVVTSGYGPRTAWHVYSLLWFGWIIRRSYGARTGLCVTLKGAVRGPYVHYGHARKLTQPELAKIPHGRRLWSYGARTVPLRSRTDCFRSLNPYGARKLIMHALKLYGPRTGGKIRTAPPGPVSGRTIFVKNRPGTSRTGPGSVMWLHRRVSHNQVYHKSHCHVIRPFRSKNTKYDIIFHWNLIIIHPGT